MGKTADLTVQKTVIDTLHKEDKPQKVIAMNGLRQAYPGHGLELSDSSSQPTPEPETTSEASHLG